MSRGREPVVSLEAVVSVRRSVKSISLLQSWWSPIQYVGEVSPEQRVRESNKES